MSRIGKKPVVIPAGVEYTNVDNFVTVKGPKGTLTRQLHKNITLNFADGVVTLTRPNDENINRSLHGLTRTLLANMVEGVTNGYTKQLDVEGVGYRCEKKGKQLIMKLGYSHEVIVEDTEDITTAVTDKEGRIIIVSGIDKQKVGQFSAEIRGKRPPEPYKGKGVRYHGEYIIRKEGKTGKGKK
ncbi:MAG: 50S ribosomal protein L6 [Oscillospiraceae bacterium]|jgi:large subunit ribosomal protein L6|nr:50S ribosomal protein L6 [Oscillospiraceae bacterium]